jgi:hypothetical protein
MRRVCDLRGPTISQQKTLGLAILLYSLNCKRIYMRHFPLLYHLKKKNSGAPPSTSGFIPTHQLPAAFLNASVINRPQTEEDTHQVQQVEANFPEQKL